MKQTADEPLPILISASVSRELVEERASQGDLKIIRDTLMTLLKDPWIGTPVPFTSGDLRDIFVLLTADKKWRVIYRAVNSKSLGKPELVILEIARSGEI